VYGVCTVVCRRIARLVSLHTRKQLPAARAWTFTPLSLQLPQLFNYSASLAPRHLQHHPSITIQDGAREATSRKLFPHRAPARCFTVCAHTYRYIPGTPISIRPTCNKTRTRTYSTSGPTNALHMRRGTAQCSTSQHGTRLRSDANVRAPAIGNSPVDLGPEGQPNDEDRSLHRCILSY
jgi:hypothetical protein